MAAVPAPHALRSRLDSRAPPQVPAVLAGAGIALAVAGAAALGAGSGAEHPALAAVARGLVVGVPLTIGLAALRRRPGSRFARLLVVTGALCLAATLAEAPDPVLYTLGRAATYAVEVLLVYVILAFPSGRLPARADRVLVGAMAALVALFFLPRLVLSETLSGPSTFTSCAQDCPPSAFTLVAQEPAFVDAVLRPLGALGGTLLTVAILVRLVRRTSSATSLARRMQVPVIALAAARALLIAACGVLAAAGALEHLAIVMWMLALSIPALALAYAAVLVRWELLRSRALRRLGRSIAAMPDTSLLRPVLARALEDPELAIVVPAAGGGWIDDRGRRLAPDVLSTRRVRPVRDDGRVVAAIVHDEALGEEPLLLEAATAMTGAVLANQRLVGESTTAARELQRERARLTSTAERERRRIETALHDGAEQRLAALRISFPLVADLVRREPERGLARLQRLESDVEAALDEIRTLAHGVCPPLLADRGLVAALRAQTLEGHLPLRVDAEHLGPSRPEVESAVFFAVVETLRAAARDAEPDADAALRLATVDDELRATLVVAGARVPRAAPGLLGGADRLGLVGGRSGIRAKHGGFVLTAVVPEAGPRPVPTPGSAAPAGPSGA